MPAITNPSIVSFVNNFVRPMADRLVGTHLASEAELATWYATISQLTAWNNAADGDPVADGSQADGRNVLTKADVANFMSVVAQMKAVSDGGGVFDVLNKPKVNVRLPS
jgi:hypothetical protein